jgi:hypothetical protein
MAGDRKRTGRGQGREPHKAPTRPEDQTPSQGERESYSVSKQYKHTWVKKAQTNTQGGGKEKGGGEREGGHETTDEDIR